MRFFGETGGKHLVVERMRRQYADMLIHDIIRLDLSIVLDMKRGLHACAERAVTFAIDRDGAFRVMLEGASMIRTELERALRASAPFLNAIPVEFECGHGLPSIIL
jgi:hypothetical protein